MRNSSSLFNIINISSSVRGFNLQTIDLDIKALANETGAKYSEYNANEFK